MSIHTGSLTQSIAADHCSSRSYLPQCCRLGLVWLITRSHGSVRVL